MQQILLIGLLISCFLAAIVPPSESREIWRNWERIQRNQQQRQGNTPRERRMQGNQEGQQEIHGAVNRSDCYKMAENFRRQGRRVRLVRVEETRNPGAVLRFQCIFQGDDAAAGWYDERRY